MKDWKLMDRRDGTWELHHLCSECFFITSPNSIGTWICLECGAAAPEEIGFVAELANCRTVAPESADHVVECNGDNCNMEWTNGELKSG